MGKKITIAEQQKITTHRLQTQKVLDALEKATGISGAFVTDDTMLADFSPSRHELNVICILIGVTIREDDLLGNIVQHMANLEVSNAQTINT
jgi:hypothetical protein